MGFPLAFSKALLGLALLGLFDALPQGPPPGDRPIAVYTDHELPPPLLEAGWRAAAAVVYLRIVDSRPSERRLGVGVRVATVEHAAQVIEVLKGDGAPTLISIEQDVTSSLDGVRHQGTSHVFAPGREYVLFLDVPQTRDRFTVSWGDGGAYPIGKYSVQVPALARRMWQGRDEVSRVEFFSSLRRLRTSVK